MTITRFCTPKLWISFFGNFISQIAVTESQSIGYFWTTGEISQNSGSVTITFCLAPSLLEETLQQEEAAWEWLLQIEHSGIAGRVPKKGNSYEFRKDTRQSSVAHSDHCSRGEIPMPRVYIYLFFIFIFKSSQFCCLEPKLTCISESHSGFWGLWWWCMKTQLSSIVFSRRVSLIAQWCGGY